MAPATTLVSSGWPATVSREHPGGASPVRARRAPQPPVVLACFPYYILPSFFYHPGPSGAPSPHPERRAGCNACPYCWQQPKLPDHRFCSDACRLSAARSAPELKYLPPHHALSVKITTRFKDQWGSASSLPKILAVYMITWTEASEHAFRRYRDGVEVRGRFQRSGCSPGNEQLRFRCTARACTLGEQGNVSLCQHDACWTCETIRVGFGPHLERKRQVPLDGCGIRLGAGIYTSSSSKADQYAVNLHDASSTVYAALVCRVVVGRPYKVNQEDPTMRRPPPGHDCVLGKSGWGSAFEDDEYVVYDADAIRAAYLVLYDKGRWTS